MELSYFNARVRGLRSNLLKAADYAILMKTGGKTAFTERLKSTVYGPYIETATARSEDPEAVLEYALKSLLSDRFSLLWKIAPREARTLLKALFSAWEVYDIKSIIRGMARGVPRDEILSTLVPAGEFDRASLSTLMEAKDIKDFIAFLSTWRSPYAHPLRKGLERYLKDGSIAQMELELDIHIFRHLFSLLSKNEENHRLVREALVLKADLQNIMTLLKTAGEGLSTEGVADFFIEGGSRLRKGAFLALSGLRNREEVLTELNRGMNGLEIKRVLLTTGPEEIALIEERFDELIELGLKRASIIDPLTIALGGAFIYASVREAKNVRLMARGLAFGMPEDEIGRLLIYPH